MEASVHDKNLSGILGIQIMYLYVSQHKTFCSRPLLIIVTSVAPLQLGKQWLLFRYDIWIFIPPRNCAGLRVSLQLLKFSGL